MLLIMGLLAPAMAHVGLDDPMPRYPSDGFSDNKACPCGIGANDSLCSVSTERSDPNRDPARVTVFDAGETITVRFYEVIGHTGRWRIAFDADGADMDDFNTTILLDEPDPAGNEGNMGMGDLWEFEVTLPDVACDNCTLQVIQVMNGNTVDPVLDPTGMSTYYQCADLELLGSADTGTNPADTADTATPADTGTTPTDTDTDVPVDTDTTPTGTTPTGTDPAGTDDPADPEDDPKGCGCDSSAPVLPGLAVLFLGALGLRRHRSGGR